MAQAFSDHLEALAQEHERVLARCAELEQRLCEIESSSPFAQATFADASPSPEWARPSPQEISPPLAKIPQADMVLVESERTTFSCSSKAMSEPAPIAPRDVDPAWVAWSECFFSGKAFLHTMLFESVPSFIGGPLCCLLESLESAKNRGLMYSRVSLSSPFLNPLVMDIFATGSPWALFIMWCAWMPEDVPRTTLYMPSFLFAYRCAVVSMKYAYLRHCDMRTIRSDSRWREAKMNVSILGASVHFLRRGSPQRDVLDMIYMSAMRGQLLPDLLSTSCPVAGAPDIWREVRRDFEASGCEAPLPFPDSSGNDATSATKPVVLRDALGLSNFEQIETQVNAGRLPVLVIAYCIVSRNFKKSPRFLMIFTRLVGFAVALLYPAARSLEGSVAFGETSHSKAILWLRFWVMGMLFSPVLIFMAFPVLDAVKRFWISIELLQIFGYKQMRQARTQPFVNLQMRTCEDIRVFWLLCRLLGPNLNRGLSIRYGSAYVCVMAVALGVGLGKMYLDVVVLKNDLSWGFTAELVLFCLCGASSITIASAVCAMVNKHLQCFLGLLNRAALQGMMGAGDRKDRDEFQEIAEATASDLELQHGVLAPVLIAYLPATPEVVLLVRSSFLTFVGLLLIIVQQASGTEWLVLPST